MRIRTRTVNDEFEITVTVPFGRHQQLPRVPTHREYLHQLGDLVGRIRHSLVNPNTPGLQNRIDAAATSLRNQTSSLRNHQAMEEGNSRSRHHDTFRYGREGWAVVEPEPAANQRPARIPGSDFAVPHSTLNLFQSIDLFAPPPPRPTARDRAVNVQRRIARYQQQLQMFFDVKVAARRNGFHVPRGQIFTLSMELSRVKQLREIVMDEDQEMVQAAAEAARRSTRRPHERSRENFSDMSSDSEMGELEEGFNPAFGSHANFFGDSMEEDTASDSEIREPEGWANLGFVMDEDYPQEVCFRIGSQQVVYPIEEVEDWVIDEQRLERRARALYRSSLDWLHLEREHERERGRERERQRADPDSRRILHTFDLPHTTRSIRQYTPAHIGRSSFWSNPSITYDSMDEYESEARDQQYTGGYDQEDDYDDPDGDTDIPDTEYEEEDQEYETDDVTEDLDHEGRGIAAPSQYQTGGQPHQNSEEGARSAHADSDDTVIDLTGSPSPAASQTRSQNTSDESNPGTASSSDPGDSGEPSAPHPVRGWLNEHTLFMYGCRGNIFDVTRQLQHAFGFQPPISPYLVGERLNGESAICHRNFVEVFLPGEEGIERRASMRVSLYQNGSASDDVYHGTQEVVEGNVRGEDYAVPAVPGNIPSVWGRGQDIAMLRELNRGNFDFEVLWQVCRELLGGSPVSDELREFLGVRLAQVRYLGINQAELATAYCEETRIRGAE